MKEIKESGKVYLTDRRIFALNSEKSHSVATNSDPEMLFLSDLPELYNLMSLFGKIQGNPEGTLWGEFKFLAEWNSLKVDEKLKKYEKYQGHELHLFL